MIFMQKSVGLPDVHSGYGFAIGELQLFDNLVVRSFTSNKSSQDFVSLIMPRKNLFIVFLNVKPLLAITMNGRSLQNFF